MSSPAPPPTLNILFVDGPLQILPANKITVHFLPSGNAPQIKFDKIKAAPDKSVSVLAQHVRMSLKLKPEEPLYLYAQQSYVPDDDLLVQDLNSIVGINNTITLHYTREPIWG